MKKLSLLIFGILSFLIFASCSGTGVDSGPYLGTGTIRIISVTPDSGLTSGSYQNFDVQVGYTLSGEDTAILEIGFGEINTNYSITTTKVEENVSASSTEVIKTYSILNVYVNSYTVRECE